MHLKHSHAPLIKNIVCVLGIVCCALVMPIVMWPIIAQLGQGEAAL